VKIEEAYRLFLLGEEREIEIREDLEVGGEMKEIPIGTRVLLNVRGRRRTVDLGFLYIANKCSKEFVRDYLNMDLSLEEIHEKYGVYTELEFVALNCLDEVKDLDAKEALGKLKAFILTRENRKHGL
jgi:hypothetical protein